jgi:hypothetical protein
VRARVALHENATASSLAAARVLVMSVWVVFLLQDPVHQLAYLPTDLFHTYGAMALVPEGVWLGLLTPAGLLGLTVVLLGLSVWALLGLRGARQAAILALLLAMVYLQLKKGFGGHFDHRELTLVYVHLVLVLTPAWDAWTLHRRPTPPRREGVYRAALVAMCLVVIVQYLFIGVARLFIGGHGVFLGGTLQNWVANRNLRPNPFGSDLGTYFLGDFWAVPLDLLFLGGTLLEVSAVVLLFLRPGLVKVGFLFSFAAFHLSIFALMNVAFPENIALLLLFFDLAALARRLGFDRPTSAGAVVVLYDPENPRARDVVARLRRRPTDSVAGVEELRGEGAVGRGVAAPEAGLVVLSATTGSVVATGERAVTHLVGLGPWGPLRKLPRRLRRGATSPVLGRRSGAAAWLLGPEGSEPSPVPDAR